MLISVIKLSTAFAASTTALYRIMATVEQAKEVIYTLSESFSSLSPEKQWSREAHEARDSSYKLLDTGTVQDIISEASKHFKAEKTLLTLSAPIVVIGDIHGQFCDLVNIFKYTNSERLIKREGGDGTPEPKNQVPLSSIHHPPLPTLIDGQYNFDPKPVEGHDSIAIPPNHTYLFLGDYVDRGFYSSECIMFLLALKVAYPSQFYMLRGNHESRCMTQMSYAEGINFAQECRDKYGDEVYEGFMNCFDSLPLAALVDNKFGQWLCCHGGIGSKVTGLDTIESLDRFQEPPLSGPFCDLIWSDPLLEEILGKRLSDKEYQEFLEIDYIPNPSRGCSCFYGYLAITPLLNKLNLLGIIRAHQCKEEGIGYAYTNNRETLFPFPLVTTLFSASNYCGTYTNKGAILIIYNDDLKVIKYKSSGESWCEYVPYCPPEDTTAATEPNAILLSEETSTKPTVEPNTVVVEPTLPAIIEPIIEETETKTDEEKEKDETTFRSRSGAIITQDNKRKTSFDLPPQIPSRSLSVSHRPSVPVPIKKRTTLRRKSMHMIRQGHTGEKGSEEFKQALQRDAQHEIHPGWSSVRRLAGVVGKMQVMRKRLILEDSSSGDESPPSPSEETRSLRKNFSQTLLDKVGSQDETQIKLIFQSIDKNNDGQLSMQEIQDFALQLGMVHAATTDVKNEMQKLLSEMDQNNDGFVSFEEFTQYLTALSLLEESKILSDDKIVTPITPRESIPEEGPFSEKSAITNA